MVSPLSLLKELKSHNKYINNKQDAIEYFDKQKWAIEAIKDTQWLQEIRLYWLRVREAACDRIGAISSNNLSDYKAVQSEMRQAKEFINFLDNMVQ